MADLPFLSKLIPNNPKNARAEMVKSPKDALEAELIALTVCESGAVTVSVALP